MTLRITQYDNDTKECVNEMICQCNTFEECYKAIDNYNTKFDIDGYYIHYFISNYKGAHK